MRPLSDLSPPLPTPAPAHSKRAYVIFAINMLVSLAIMYLGMFTMIDGWQDFRVNLNMVYMAVTMAAPMGIVMLATMGDMYTNQRVNLVLHVGLVVLFIAAFGATRTQAVIDDEALIDSMVPHHSGAILMCREASLENQQLVALCGRIERVQRSEIELMNAIRTRLE